jgi:hypothetical protein
VADLDILVLVWQGCPTVGLPSDAVSYRKSLPLENVGFLAATNLFKKMKKKRSLCFDDQIHINR